MALATFQQPAGYKGSPKFPAGAALAGTPKLRFGDRVTLGGFEQGKTYLTPIVPRW